MKKFPSYIIVIIWCAIIFGLSSRPGLAVAEGVLDFATRKPAHIFVYFILTVLSFRALVFDYKIKKALILALGFSLLYSVSDEVHQIFVPLREGKILDIIFDAAGSLAAVLLIWKLQPSAQTKLLLLDKSSQANLIKE